MLCGIPQYIQCMHHGLTFVPLVSHFSSLTAQGVSISCDGFPIHLEWELSILVTGFIVEVLLEMVMLCNSRGRYCVRLVLLKQ